MVDPFASRDDGMDAHGTAGKVKDVFRTNILLQIVLTRRQLTRRQHNTPCRASSQTMATSLRNLYRRPQALR
jgi:hypothetical protein